MTDKIGRLDGKVAVVMGAGQSPGPTLGNGRAIATLFAQEGAKVVCVDRDLARAQETVKDIHSQGNQAFAIEGDVTSLKSCQAVIDSTLASYGALDIQINNVGIGGRGDGPAHKMSADALDQILDVNLKGAWRAISAALPTLQRQNSGSIVNISSLASQAGGFQVAYEVSKAALNRLTQSVAQSHAKYNIRCNAILPGLMDTPMAVDGIAAAQGRPREDVKAERDARVPLGKKMGTAWDTAYAALFLASDEAKFITGALLPVDGGMGSRVG
jgi:NAD(P)-dependent dehydrogenase (short-subunit alcohol dehydrogenase family)